MTTTGAKFVLDKKEIPADKNAYVFRNPQNKNRWYLYFYDRAGDRRYRLVLKDDNGNHPPPTTEGQDAAWILGIAKFVELKGKSDRGEKISTLTFGDMVKKFLTKEHRRISTIPHNGISPARYRLLCSQTRWLREFINDDKKPVHRIRRNAFLTYEVWRKERALQLEKEIPRPTTINQEFSTLRRMFSEVAVSNGFLTRDTTPEIPNVKLPKDKKHRYDDLTDKEWKELERCARDYWIKGLTRILDDKYTMEKEKGQWKTKETLGISKRAQLQRRHRQLIYWAMRISMDCGIRIGSLRKIKWRDITVNTTLRKEDQKTFVIINVPPENTKTGRFYKINAPIAKHLAEIRKATDFKKPDDLLFLNQKTGQPISNRIFQDYLCELLVEARLANWAEDDSNNFRKVDIFSGKSLVWYSFRHSYITMRLKAGTPVAVIANQCDTSIKYIEEHYFHYRAEEATQILTKGRKGLKPAIADLNWIDEI